MCAVLVTSVFRILCRFSFPASDISSVYNTFFNNNSRFPEVVSSLTFHDQDIAILAKIKVSWNFRYKDPASPRIFFWIINGYSISPNIQTKKPLRFRRNVVARTSPVDRTARQKLGLRIFLGSLRCPQWRHPVVTSGCILELPGINSSRANANAILNYHVLFTNI